MKGEPATKRLSGERRFALREAGDFSVTDRDLSGERWAVIFSACTFVRTSDVSDWLSLKHAVEKYQAGVAENEKRKPVR